MKTNHTTSAILVLGLLVTVLAWSNFCGVEPATIFSNWKVDKSTPGDRFRSAAVAGDIEEMKRLLAKGADVNSSAANGWSPLTWAQIGNQPEAIELLLSKGAAIDSRDKAGYTALHQAAMAGRLKAIAILLKHGASVETVSRTGYTPLMDASRQGRAMAVELLLAQGADPNQTSRNGYTPLSLAERGHHRHVALLLVANCEDPALQRKRLQTALANLNDKGGGPRLRLAGQLRKADALEALYTDGPSPGCVQIRAVSRDMVPENWTMGMRGQSVGAYLGRQTSAGPANAKFSLREAIHTWQPLQSKHPDLDKRICDMSQNSLQSQRPELVPQLLNIAGIAR